MTAYTATELVPPRFKEGYIFESVFKHTEPSGGYADADTITCTNAIPQGAQIIDVTLTTAELDTNASPTMDVSVGDGTDVDGFIAGANLGGELSNDVLTITSTGAQVGQVYTADTNVVATFVNNPATAANNSTPVVIRARYYCSGLS